MEKYIRPEHIERFIQEVILFLPRVPIALIFLIIGWLIIGFILRGFRFALSRRNLDPALKNFLLSITSIFLKIIVLISVASTVGIATTSFITMLGAAGLAIGLALQGSLSNFAGSVLIMIFKPFRIGDNIVALNQEGVVKDITIFNTILNTADNQRVIIPNGVLANGVIVNTTAEKNRRIIIKVSVSYNDDINKAREILLSQSLKDKRIIQVAPYEPVVVVRNFAANTVELELRVWVATEQYWPVFFFLMEEVRAGFASAKINLAQPPTDVKVISPNP